MKAKIFGISLLFVVLCVYLSVTAPGAFLSANNIENLLQRTALYGILGIGVAFVIMTSGIDLSIGSIVCLAGAILALLLRVSYSPPDEHRVLAVQAVQKRIIVPGQVTAFKTGDRIRYDGGRRAHRALLTVTSVGDHEFQENGRTIAATAINVDRPLSGDDTYGQIAKTYEVLSFQQYDPDAGQGSELTIAGVSHGLAPRDQLDLVHPEGRLKQPTITAIDVGESSTRLTLSDDLGGIDNQWVAIPRVRRQRMPVLAAVGLVLGSGAALGLLHGLLITKMKLQPFVVTLCGLLIYRGLARWFVNDQPQGFGQEYSDSLSRVAEGKFILIRAETFEFGIPYPFFILVAVAVVAAVFLNKTIWGRYLLALGRNEAAARYSGIDTHRITIVAYVICTFLAALGGMLFALDANSVSPSSFGNFFELYAIAAAVLGGCSLRGGEGGIFGVVIGTAVMQTLKNLILIKRFPDSLEFAIIGAVILVGVLVDEMIKRYAAQRRVRKETAE